MKSIKLSGETAMEIRSILYVIVIISSTMIGIVKYLKYRERYLLLMDYINLLEVFRIELEYRRAPLPEVFRKCGCTTSKAARFFRRMCDMLNENRHELLSHIWSEAASDIYKDSALIKEDLEIICELGKEIGTTGTKGQNHLIELNLHSLRKQLKVAEEEMKTKGKMYISFGLAIGIFIVILLI